MSRGAAFPRGLPRLRLGRAIALAWALGIAAWCPSPPASAAPDAGHPVAPAAEGSPVRVGETIVFTVKIARAGISPADRAARANRMLEQEIDSGARNRVRLGRDGDVAVVFVGRTPIFQLGPDDARAAGDTSVQVLAGRVARELDVALARERRRARMANEVFSASLVIFAGLLSYLLVRRFDAIAVALHARLRRRAKEAGGLKVGAVELLEARGLRRLVDGSVSIASVLLKLATFFAWVTFSLSLFPSLHGVRDRMVHAFVSPMVAVLGRLAAVVETGFIVLVLGVVLVLLLRFVGLFFESVAKGETRIALLPPSQALLASGLVRIALVVVVVAVAIPILSAQGSGFLSKLVDAALLALGFGLSPLAASMLLGARLVFSGSLRVGDEIVFGERSGEVEELGLLGVTLRHANGNLVFLPYLPILFHPVEVRGRSAERKGASSDPPPPTSGESGT
ncbi:MAG: mechanosensitive ion channel [Polyangiales bacterium]